MNIVYDPDRKVLDTKAVEVIEIEVRNILEVQDKVVFAVCGGTSVSGIFEGLKNADIPWEKVHIFMVDERLVTIAHKDSNYRLAYRSFIEYLEEEEKLPQANAYPFVLTDKDDQGISIYTNDLIKLGGNYDICLLSSGEDGHIGALYPNHHSVLDESEHFIVMDDSPKPPPERMSMSRKLLLRSKTAILLFFGEGKKEAFHKFGEESGWEDMPARLVKELPNSYVLTDQK